MVDRDDLEFAKSIAEPLREPERGDPAFEARLLLAVRAAADRGEAPWMRQDAARPPLGGPLRWLVSRRPLAISPLAGLAVAAGFAAIVSAATLVVSGDRVGAASAVVSGGVVPDETARKVVQFAIVAPTASAVTLVGDFNAWDATTTPMTKGAIEGLWTVTLPLPAGSYQYAFVIDGTAWMADPAAPMALEDEFGTPSSILTIRGGRT